MADPKPYKGIMATMFGPSLTEAAVSLSTPLVDIMKAAQPELKPSRYRTKPCKTWKKTGSCPYGDRCTFQHDRSPSTSPSPNPGQIESWNKVPLCKFYAKGCRKGSNCRFRHGNESPSSSISSISMPPSSSSSKSSANSEHEDDNGCSKTKLVVASPNAAGRQPTAHSLASSLTASKGRNQGMIPVSRSRVLPSVYASPPAVRGTGKKRWKDMQKPKALPSFIAQEAQQRLLQQQEENNRCLGDPPAGKLLTQLRIVLPSGHGLLQQLHDLSVFDDIRRSKMVWITAVEVNVIALHAETMKRLREALGEVNRAVRDMRLSAKTISRVFLQAPVQATAQCRVMLSEMRPKVIEPPISPSNSAVAVNKAAAFLVSEFEPPSDALLGSTKELEMRVNFGFAQLQGLRSGRDSLSYAELERLMQQAHGSHATLETRFCEAYRAEMLLLHLTNPVNEVCSSPNLIRENCVLSLLAENSELSADIIEPSDPQPQLANVRLIDIESGLRSDLLTICPDLKYDWAVQVKSFEHKAVTEDIDSLMMSVRPDPAVRKGSHDMLKQPSLRPLLLGELGDKVSETRLRTSATIPWKDTPYLVEIGITTAWKGINFRSKPRVYWNVQFYGSHWDSAMNRTEPGTRRKDWGAGLCDVWTGEAVDLEDRLADFMREVLEFQALLERFA